MLKNIWGGGVFLGVEIYSRDLEENLIVLNVYGPCVNREIFWQKLLDSPILQAGNIILGGNLNFSIGFSESWGHLAQIDPLSDYFGQLLEDHHWIDLPSTKLQFTWKNNRSGDQSLARRLDHFIMKEGLCSLFPRARQWVGSGGISDHRPIFLEIEARQQAQNAPYKFNATWLRDPSYLKLITDYWNAHPISENTDPVNGLVRNLSEIKGKSREWAKTKRKQDDQILSQAEQAIEALEENSDGTYISPKQKTLFEDLIKRRSQILRDREDSWRLRSRAIWLKEGDENSKFFHRFANGRKAINTIWELKDEQGHQVSNQGELAHLASSHFKNI